MPVDASIALAGKPPVLPELDLNKTFLTLGQLKYLAAQTAVAQTAGADAAATLAAKQRVRGVPLAADAGAPLASIGQPAPGGMPGAGAPVLPTDTTAPPASGANAPSVPAQSPQQRTPAETATLARALIAADPFEGAKAAKDLMDLDTLKLTNAGTQLAQLGKHAEIGANLAKDIKDQAGLDRARLILGHITGGQVEHLPTVYSPDAVAQLANMTRSAQQKIEEGQKTLDQAIAAHTAETQRILASTGAAAETRLGAEVFATPMAEGGPATTKRFGGGTTQVGGIGPTLEQANARAGHEAGLAGQFREATKDYDTIRDAMTMIRSAPDANPKDPRASDQVLVAGFAKLVRGAPQLNPEQRNSLLGTVQQYADTLAKGATLDAGQRRSIFQSSEHLAQLSERNYNAIRDHYRTRARGLPNVRPEVIAPDFLSTAPPVAQPAGRASGAQPDGSIVVPRATLPALAQRFGISVEAMEQRILTQGDTVGR